MPTIQVMRQIAEDLSVAFPELVLWRTIYLAPTVIPLPSASPLEIQICEGGTAYIDHDGSCRREQFNILIGIVRKYALDSSGRHSAALSDLAKSLFVYKKMVIDRLDGSFLTDNLLTRPLIIVAESKVEKGDKVLYKTLTFTGGLNVEWAG